MLSVVRTWWPLGLLALAVRDSYAGGADDYHVHEEYSVTTTTCTAPPVIIPSTLTLVDHETFSTTTTTTTTSPTTTTTPTTKTVPTTQTVPTTITVSITATVITTIYSTTYATTTIPTTTVVTSTVPTTTTLTSTFTTFPLRTSYTTLTVFDPCPKFCSITVGTVNVVYWPTSGGHSYPATYADPTRDYTFTSPSVYFLINTMYGTNSAGRVGPSASSTIWAFDLDQVSTLVLPAETETRQLYLNDLATDCPQSFPADVLATKKPDPSCDPILVAPTPIRRWAWPCNACGAFGLFDPPYAVPTVTNGLLGTTTVTPAPSPVTPAPTAPPTTAPAAPVSTITTTITDGNSRIVMLEVFSGTVLLSSSAIATQVVAPTTTAAASPTSQTSTTSSSPVATAAAARVTGGAVYLILSFIISVSLL